MIVLDTNVISELMEEFPDSKVVEWIDAQAADSICTSSVSLLETLYGLEIMPEGKRRRAYRKAFEKMRSEVLQNRILPFDSQAAGTAAPVQAQLRAIGRPVEIRDLQIAGIALARNATLTTRNTRHFVDAGVKLVNP